MGVRLIDFKANHLVGRQTAAQRLVLGDELLSPVAGFETAEPASWPWNQQTLPTAQPHIITRAIRGEGGNREDIVTQ